jgi:LuxR family maltose regulon positive regulatory protein
MRPMASSRRPVDIARQPSLSFANPDAPQADPTRPVSERPPIPVSPGSVPDLVQTLGMGARRHDVDGVRVQATKVQRPPLRDETLARDRLLDWLDVKIHHRVVLVLAEAGYGKTTLLADFSRRTRLRTLWFRLDEEDRDWVSFLGYLVAAGRQHDPDFAPKTAAMLADGSIPGPTRDTVVEMFLRELPSIAEHGAVLIFDDFHLVDDDADVRHVVRELVAGAPERLTLVFASRRVPNVPMGRLRALGEVAELRTDDLRFDATETARLFSESYGRTLEPDVVADLSARTEGWAASLQLVQAALRDRSPSEIRRFVRNLTGADQELYDYLAEEVIGELPEELQLFLMRTSILQVVTAGHSELVTGLDGTVVRALIRTAERLALLTRRGPLTRDALKYHPLVREFLEDRLDREFGAGSAREAHRHVARSIGRSDWQTAAHHLSEAQDHDDLAHLIDLSVHEVMAKGAYFVAEAYIKSLGSQETKASFEVILSRADVLRGDLDGALVRARLAQKLEPTAPFVVYNLAAVALGSDAQLAANVAVQFASSTSDDAVAEVGKAMATLTSASVDGEITSAIKQFTELRARQAARNHTYFEGITLLNLADLHRAAGAPVAALAAADESIAILEASSAHAEASAARVTRAWALRCLGRDGSRDIQIALAQSTGSAHATVAIESADIELLFGDLNAADRLLNSRFRDGRSLAGDLGLILDVSHAHLALRQGDVAVAEGICREFRVGTAVPITGNKARQLALRAHLAVLQGSADAGSAIHTAVEHAERQGSGLWSQYARGLQALSGPEVEFSTQTHLLANTDLPTLTMLAELVSSKLEGLDESALGLVVLEAERFPARWRDALRAVIDADQGNHLSASRLLDQIGTIEDVKRLRRVAKRHRGRPDSTLGKSLARRIAPRVFVEDQGRVTLVVGDKVIEGTNIRRKVLALLCFLLTRPRYAATRDEVVEALWPEFDPSVALNSLNQTVYFLRRVFEPDYQEDWSPGYLRHESDLVWLDPELVNSRARSCYELLRTMPAHPSTSDVEALAAAYVAPFALDFAYEDWAASYRDGLHASYLRIVENAVTEDSLSGHFDRGIALARRALQLAPDAEQLELSLLRLYKMSGSHAAAAEQYAHYAEMLRSELGLEPPSLESL